MLIKTESVKVPHGVVIVTVYSVVVVGCAYVLDEVGLVTDAAGDHE